MVNKSRINDPRTWKQWSESGALGTLATAHQPKQLEDLWRNEEDASIATVLKEMVREAGLSDYLKVRPDTYLTFVTQVKKRGLDAKVFAYWTLHNVLGSGGKRVTPEYLPPRQLNLRIYDRWQWLERDLYESKRDVRRSLQELITGVEGIDKEALELRTTEDEVVLSVRSTSPTSPEGLQALAAVAARFVRLDQREEQRVEMAPGYGHALRVVPRNEVHPHFNNSLTVVATGLNFGTRLIGHYLLADLHRTYQICGREGYRPVLEQLQQHLGSITFT